MIKFIRFLTITILLIGLLVEKPITEASNFAEESILIVYTTETNEMTLAVKQLHLLLAHFSSDVQHTSLYELSTDLIQQSSVIIYIGELKEELGQDLVNKLNEFTGKLIVIGENATQLKGYESLQFLGDIQVTQVQQLDRNGGQAFSLEKPIKHVKLSHYERMMLTGYKAQKEVPIFIEVTKDKYYFAANVLDKVASYYFADILHDIIRNDHKQGHMTYIRLEGIHPLVDSNHVHNIGQYLNEREIPYLLSVQPIYIEPSTGKVVYLSQSKQLVEVLQTLQAEYGTVVIQSDYSDEDAIQGERVDEKRLAINELVLNDLYPLALGGHLLTSISSKDIELNTFYKSLYGNYLFKDTHSNVTPIIPYDTRLPLQDGLRIFPETLGFVDSTLKNPYEKIEREWNKALIVRDSVIGVGYHTYLGVELLPGLLEKLDRTPNITWIRANETDQRIETNNVTIVSNEQGEVTVTKISPLFQNWLKFRQITLLEKVLWGITGLVALFITVFLSIVFYLRIRLKKTIFKERSSNG